MNVYKVEELQYLQIGRQGESQAVEIGIDVSKWVDELAGKYPRLHFHLLYKAYGQSIALPMSTVYYPDEKLLVWTVNLGATYLQGQGYSEVRALNFPDNGLLKKSRVIPTLVENSVSGIDGGTPPAPYEDWVNLVLDTKDRLQELLASPVVTYHNSDDGIVAPTDDDWTTTPNPVKGKYLWTKILYNWNIMQGDLDDESPDTETPVYTVSYVGFDGEGSVESVNGESGGIWLDGTNLYVNRVAETPELIQNAVNRIDETAAQTAQDLSDAKVVLNNSIALKLDASKIAYGDTAPASPVKGMIWLKPKT